MVLYLKLQAKYLQQHPAHYNQHDGFCILANLKGNLSDSTSRGALIV